MQGVQIVGQTCNSYADKVLAAKWTGNHVLYADFLRSNNVEGLNKTLNINDVIFVLPGDN